jgi:predicted AAA+ superfamily ATPase
MMETAWLNRYYEPNTGELFQKEKVFVLFGPRRVGKTELVKKMIADFKGTVFSGTGDNLDLREVLSSQRLQKIKSVFNKFDLIFIDEAQRIPDIGYSIKLFIDNMPDKIVVLTGSSSFELSGQVGEPLTGRQKQKILYPLSIIEMAKQFGGMHLIEHLEEYLIFGFYPEVLKQNTAIDKTEYLISIRDSYLLKDIFDLEEIKHRDKIFTLLRLLAYQIGNTVSLNKLANNLGIAKQSVERYISLLEKAFIIKRIGGFSRNLRSEITKSSRFYFLDNGIRNAVINNFNPISSRNDVGMLWENFMIMERLKKQEYERLFSNNYFWRTYSQQEIDLIEDRGGKLHAYEFKYGKAKAKAPKSWMTAYPDSAFHVITPDNFLEFLVS